jgi:hypothetical protein
MKPPLRPRLNATIFIVNMRALLRANRAGVPLHAFRLGVTIHPHSGRGAFPPAFRLGGCGGFGEFAVAVFQRTRHGINQ